MTITTFIMIGVFITVGLFFVAAFVTLLTMMVDTKSVAFGIATVTITVSGKFLYGFVDAFIADAALGRTAAIDIVLLAISFTLGTFALLVVFVVDKYYKKNNSS